MSHSILESKNISWLHVGETTEEDLAALQEQFKFHHLDYDDIRSKPLISKMDVYKHYLFFVFHIPRLNEKTHQVYGEPLYVFLNATECVTLTHQSIPSVEAVFEHLRRSQKFRHTTMGKGTAFLMYRLLLEIFRESITIVSALAEEVTRLEHSIEDSDGPKLTVSLGRVRRNVLYIRHIIDPQRAILTSLVSTKRPFIPEDLIVYFDDLHDVLDTMSLTSDNLKLMIDGLFDINEALLSHRTNQMITVLTFVSASLMIPTFIAGFYGMNVPWLPFVTQPFFVFVLFGLGFALMLVFVRLMLKKRSV